MKQHTKKKYPFYRRVRYIEQDAKQGPPSQFVERAGGGLQACPSSKELRGLSARAQVRVISIYIFPRSLLRGFPQSWFPRAARRGAAHRSATQGPGNRALCHSSSLSINLTVLSNTFTSCDLRPFSWAPISRVKHFHVVRLEAVLLSPPCRCWTLGD